MIKGLKKIAEQAEQNAQYDSSSFSDRIRYLKMENGGFANIRFLTNGDEIVKAKVHSIEKLTPKGTRFSKVYCLQQDGQACPHCVAGTNAGSYIYAWVYVSAIYHLSQNPYAEKNPEEAWEKMTSKNTGKTYFLERPTKPMVFVIPRGQGGKYEQELIDYMEEYGSLVDRAYKFSRKGTQTQTSYTLTPQDKSDLPKEALEMVEKGLPDLEEVVKGHIRSFSQASGEPASSV
jgi:hypothetical protein